MMLITFNLLPVFFGSGFYSQKVSDTWTFMPDILAQNYYFRDYAMIVVVYVGVIYSGVLIYKLYKGIEGLKTRVIVTLQLVQHFGCYFLMYSFDDKVPFVHEHAALAYISVLFLYAIITTKMIVCYMAKMEYSFIHLEYLVFVPYFYIQSQYDGSTESEALIKQAFCVTFAVIFLLYFRFVQCCISQLTNYLGIYCFVLGPRKEKEQ
mmetsp:Transcript_11466/g.10128  ORF Transcript_11466/g.10128 Transcript_11466/m.10128 type:complete len:207 (+) Transcript_11466:318-938(+)